MRDSRPMWKAPPGYTPANPVVFNQATDNINGLLQMAAKEDKAAGRQHPPNSTKVWKWMGQWTRAQSRR